MVRKAGGKLSTKELGVEGDHKEARVGVAQLPALLKDEDEGRVMSWLYIQEGNAYHGHSITSVRPERLRPGRRSESHKASAPVYKAMIIWGGAIHFSSRR